MSRFLPVFATILLMAGSAQARGLLVPTEKNLPPLALLAQQVHVQIDDQVAVTRVEQTFRNNTSRPLEATYIFPVPKGASVREFAMWVDGKKIPGELVEADQARKIYTDIVQRMQDPGLLEYMDANLFRLKVFPVPANGDQKISISFTSLAESDHGSIEYRYPLKTDAKALETLQEFGLHVQIKSQHRLQSIYSPSHAVTVARKSDHEAAITFENKQALLDKDFQLYYTIGDNDIGLTALAHRPWATHDGYFMLLIAPRAELSKEQQVPRDLVFVLDTSGSMAGKRIVQARNALKFCLRNLNANDRFSVLHFANTVNRYSDGLESASADNVDRARQWVERLEATGGTAIQAALASALEMRPSDRERTFTVVFFTDGRPTVGETDLKKIQAHVSGKNTSTTRIFTFGVGDDVNATLLDGLAEQSRAVATYVRESEDIEERVSSFYSKINHPVFANLRLTAGPEIKLAEVYPPELPDLFHGSQLIVLGRYSGDGKAALKLAGDLGTEKREFVYNTVFPAQTKEEKTFVEDLWARRKVGYLLDQIRRNGEVKELKDEVIRLAKRHGIATPYTSYLVAPDEAVDGRGNRPISQGPPRPDVRFQPHDPNRPASTTSGLPPTGGFGIGGGIGASHGYQINPTVPGGFGMFGGGAGPGSVVNGKTPLPGQPSFAPVFVAPQTQLAPANGPKDTSPKLTERPGKEQATLAQVRQILADGRLTDLDSGKVAIDLAEHLRGLRSDSQVSRTSLRTVNGRTCVQLGGAWIDDGFNDKLPTIAVKALGRAYFRMLERQPEMRDVFALGNYLIWVTPNGTALIIDLNNGREDVPDVEIDRLFAGRK